MTFSPLKVDLSKKKKNATETYSMAHLKFIYFLADFLQQMFETARLYIILYLFPANKTIHNVPLLQQSSDRPQQNYKRSSPSQSTVLQQLKNSCSGNSYVFAIIIIQMATETPVLRPVYVWSPARHLCSETGHTTMLHFWKSEMKSCIFLWSTSVKSFLSIPQLSQSEMAS